MDDNSDWVKWGRLVATWAKDPSKRPASVPELNEQMANANVGASFSTETFTDLHMCQAPDAKTLQIFLPTAASIDRRLQELGNPGSWRAPIFYSELAGLDTFNVAEGKKEDFMYCRIGEYSIGQCG